MPGDDDETMPRGLWVWLRQAGGADYVVALNVAMRVQASWYGWLHGQAYWDDAP